MPTLKLDINTGIEYAPTDGIDAGVKLHNFTVGTDGSLYKLPALKNLKNTTTLAVPDNVSDCGFFTYPIQDIKKFQTTSIEETIPLPSGVTTGADRFRSMNMIRRFVYLTIGSYGVFNIDYDGERILNADLPTDVDRFGEFEKIFLDINNFPQYLTGTPHTWLMELTSLNPNILVDFNSQYEWHSEMKNYKNRHIKEDLVCVFPCQYRWNIDPDHDHPTKNLFAYDLLIKPRNVVVASMDATDNGQPARADAIPKSRFGHTDDTPLAPPGTYLKPLESNEKVEYFDPDSYRYNNDLVRGCFSIGNRMFFYSASENAIYVSKQNQFTSLFEAENNSSSDFRIIPTEEIQGFTSFNGNIVTFSPSGLERWVLSSDVETLLERDPTFHYDHRIRYGGSFTKANRNLYYYTDDFQVYRLNSDLSVDNIFSGTLPVYKPIEDYLTKEKDLPLAYFKMLGYRFVSIGPWLYNIDSQTWSTYNFDGWKKPNLPAIMPIGASYDPTKYIWSDDTAKQVVSVAYDDIICTYSTICRALSYKEMQDALAFDDTEPSLEENKHQWGEVAFFTTRVYHDDRTFSLDGVEVYVRGGILTAGEKLYLKILRGSDKGDFTEGDEATYGIAAIYEPIEASTLGDLQSEHTGKFIWHTNVKTDRFRLQFVTTSKRGIVIQAVLANITKISDSQEFLVNQEQQKQQSQQGGR